MKILRGLFVAGLFLFLFSCAPVLPEVNVSSGRDTANFPDFTREPYKLVGRSMLQSFFYPENGLSVARQYYTLMNLTVGGDYIIVFINPDGSYEYAEWLHINKFEDGTFKGVMRGFMYKPEKRKFVFENEEEWREGKTKSDKAAPDGGEVA